jgi:DNA-binding ferritin-like protein
VLDARNDRWPNRTRPELQFSDLHEQRQERMRQLALLFIDMFKERKMALRRRPHDSCYNCRAVKSLPTNEAEVEFLELLKQLQVGPEFTEEFVEILKQEWTAKTSDGAAIVARLLAQLREQQELQEKLVAAYLRGERAIVPLFERMNTQFGRHRGA